MITLTCTVTGKQVTWTNKAIIDQKIKQYGSLDNFKANYVCREAKASKAVKKPLLMKQLFEQGIKLAPISMANNDYIKYYEDKIADMVATNAPQREIDWMVQRLDRWRAPKANR